MRLRRALGVGAIFVLGLACGALLLYGFSPHPASNAVAQRRALNILDQQPRPVSIGDNRIVDAVKRISAAVVNIDIVGKLKEQDTEGAPFFANQEVRGKGSGVVVTPDGYIVTNYHVIEGASRIRVTFPDGQWYYADLIGRDAQSDLAVIRVAATHLVAAELGNSDRLQVGEWSIAVGNPLGLGSSVTVGVISALNRHNLQIEEGRNLEGAIQTDAAINRGNSGGALANIEGQLVGINTAILSAGPSGGSIGLGFAIPVNAVRRVVRDLIVRGTANYHIARQPWLGIQFGPVRENVGQALGLTHYHGAQIAHVLPETPASIAGLEDDDIILSIDGKEIDDQSDVRDAVQQHKAGERAHLRILRPSERREYAITVVVQEKPDPKP